MCSKNLAQNGIIILKNFSKVFNQNKFWVQKYLGPKKLGPKYFSFKRFESKRIWSKKIGRKKLFGPKKLDKKKIRVFDGPSLKFGQLTTHTYGVTIQPSKFCWVLTSNSGDMASIIGTPTRTTPTTTTSSRYCSLKSELDWARLVGKLGLGCSLTDIWGNIL